MPDFSDLYRLADRLPLATGITAALLLFVIAAALFRRLRPWHSHLRGKPILTPYEREFFHRLTRALPTHHVFPQVALSALIVVDGPLTDRQRFSIRRRFGWKYADFVICAPFTLNVLAVIELDERTHDASRDRKRDAMMQAAGYQTLRFHSKHKPTVAELSELFAKLLPTLKA